jgi:hypothetical protein
MFHWIARYKDGAIIKQLDGDKHISSDDIDRNKLSEFILMDDSDPIIHLHISEGQKLIYRRRIEITEGIGEIACHLVGWRKKIGEKILQSILFIFEDGHVEMMSDFQEDSRWFYQPVLREFELPCH